MKKLIFFISIAILGASCEKDADIQLPKIDPMIGVYGFLEAGEPLQIELTDVRSIYEPIDRTNNGRILGALVTVTQGDSVYTLTELGTGLYGHNHFVVAGATYQIQVQKSGYKTASATCTVPTYEVGQIEMEYLAMPDIDLDSTRRFGFRFKDKAGERNYYRFGLIGRFDNNTGSEVYFSTYNLSDDNKDGQEMYTGLGSSYLWGSSQTQHLQAEATIITMNEDLFKYQTSYDAYWMSEDNPFAEPVIMYSNITNGVGIFGGLIRKVYTVQIY